MNTITGEDDERGGSFFLYALSCSDQASTSSSVSSADNKNSNTIDPEIANIRRQSMLAARKRQSVINGTGFTARELMSEEKKHVEGDLKQKKQAPPGLSLPLEELLKQCKTLLEDIETTTNERKSSKWNSAIDAAASGLIEQASKLSTLTTSTSSSLKPSEVDAFFSLHDVDSSLKSRYKFFFNLPYQIHH